MDDEKSRNGTGSSGLWQGLEYPSQYHALEAFPIENEPRLASTAGGNTFEPRTNELCMSVGVI